MFVNASLTQENIQIRGNVSYMYMYKKVTYWNLSWAKQNKRGIWFQGSYLPSKRTLFLAHNINFVITGFFHASVVESTPYTALSINTIFLYYWLLPFTLKVKVPWRVQVVTSYCFKLNQYYLNHFYLTLL